MEEGYFFFNGRPEAIDCEPNEIAVYDFLERLNVGFKTLKHPAAFTIAECNKVRDRIEAPVFKNLFLTNKQQTKFYLLVMPGEKNFKTKYLSSQIGSSRLSFAGEEQMMEFLGVRPGAVTPMGLINDSDKRVKVLLDEDLKSHRVFACHPCVNTASVVLTLNDLVDAVIPATGHEAEWVTLPWE